MNIRELKEMLQLMQEHDLSEIEVEKDGLKVKLKKSTGGKVLTEQVHAGLSHVVTVPGTGAPKESGAGAAPAELQEPSDITVVRSPMVGTFYTAPAPDQPSYVSVGKAIHDGDVLCIVEAMKLMNEIKSEISGTIVEVLVPNGQPVEFDQPLFKVKTS